MWVDVALISLLLFLSLGIIYSLSVLLAVIKYWNYTLTVHDERLQYEAGLFNRVACGFRKHKLQTVIIRQSFVAGLLKRYSLEIRQTNEAMAKQGVPSQGFMIPVITETQLQQIMTLLALDEFSWQKTLPVQIFWRTLFAGGLLTLFVAIIVIAGVHISPLWISLPIPLIAVWSWKYWHSTRYSLTENGFAVKRGLLGYSISYIPQIKVQKICLEQGPIGHTGNHGKLKLWSGATREAIGYVDMTALRICQETILQKVSGHRGRWM
ncbi:MAG: hypothetical protein EOO07_32670 [Chitinophagaceae bacterium]|nr:MAG: hypothetical protein EOO07_32670 [Chitinophagaceae bacterium]